MKKLINIITKAGVLKGQQVIVLILRSQKHKWIKAFKVRQQLSPNAFTKKIILDAISISYALNHVKDKYRKKKVVVYNDSSHTLAALKRRNGKWIGKTNVVAIENLRDVVCSFSNVQFKKIPNNMSELKKELEHLFIECAIDNIEVDEKE